VRQPIAQGKSLILIIRDAAEGENKGDGKFNHESMKVRKHEIGRPLNSSFELSYFRAFVIEFELRPHATNQLIDFLPSGGENRGCPIERS
jgi:hypothetical protein